MEDVEELDDENCKVEPDTKFDLYWKCPNCGYDDNAEYNIDYGEAIECICEKCNKKYSYYWNPY